MSIFFSYINVDMSKMMAPNVVFVFGGPGAGKSTQCEKLANESDFEHISVDNLLSIEKLNPESPCGDYFEQGKIVPAAIICSLIEQTMLKSNGHKFLIEGFPRNKEHLDEWNRAVGGMVHFKFVLLLDCSHELCMERCLHRGGNDDGKNYEHLEKMTNEMNTYISETKPILGYYEDMGLVRKVDGSQHEDDVFTNVKYCFQGCV